MPPQLPQGTTFTVPSRGTKKYTAVVPAGRGRPRALRVSFGHRAYGHYRDQVPRGMGGGKWTKSDHNDAARRANYRSRHGGMKCAGGERCVDVRYSPAWFSYYFLW